MIKFLKMLCVFLPTIVVFQLLKLGRADIIDLDLCQYETFQPACQSGEVLVIETAKYGRMDVGRCVELDEKHSDDPSWIGCSVDVTDVLRRKCSAKSGCSVPVKDKDLEIKERPCYKGLTTYLNAKYQCMTVLSQFDRCDLQVKSEKSSFLIPFAQILYRSDYCGSKERPWTMEAHNGQKISIRSRLMASKLSHDSYERCLSGRKGQIKVGYLTDKNLRNSEEFCLDSEWEIGSQYQSKSNSLELVLAKPLTSNDSFVMIEITVSGCLDLIPPEDAWLKRTDVTATIGCFASRQTWHLRCIGNQWIGVVGNCSMGKYPNQMSEDDRNPEDRNENGQALVLTAICGFGLVICTVIVCCGIFCVKRISKGYKKSLDNFYSYGQVTSKQHPHVANGTQQTLTDSKEHYNFFKEQGILHPQEDSAYFVLDHEERKVQIEN